MVYVHPEPKVILSPVSESHSIVWSCDKPLSFAVDLIFVGPIHGGMPSIFQKLGYLTAFTLPVLNLCSREKRKESCGSIAAVSQSASQPASQPAKQNQDGSDML